MSPRNTSAIGNSNNYESTSRTEILQHEQVPEVITENVLDEHYRYLKDPSGYTLYPQRWYLLTVICVVNFTNAMVCY